MIFIFIDGFGLGQEDISKNPIYAAKTPAFDYIFQNSSVRSVDASMGVKGLPQSATGQTAIFTGVNAPEVLGRHMSGQPTITLKKIIERNNMFMELINMGLKVTNSNAYREEYLVKMLDPKERKYRPSVTSVMTMSAGLNFREAEDYKKGNAVYHDITGEILKDHGLDIELITPGEAAQRLYSISRKHDFTLYEHFMTDIIGHKADMGLAVEAIELLDSFLGEVISLIDLSSDIIIIVSDHGNIEDISVRTHTMNRVPVIIMGNTPEKANTDVKDLTDVMPMVINIFKTSKMMI